MQKQTKSEQAYQGVRKMIITGEFTLDSGWSLRTLAEKFEMSVAPITEAVRRLEQEGILQVRPQQGIMVRQLSLKEIQECTIVREAVELQAARILAASVNREDEAILREMGDQLSLLLKQGRYSEADYQDYLLHRELVRRTGMPLLLKHFEQVAVVLFLTSDGGLGSAFTRDGDLETGRHENMLETIFSGSPETAEAAVREHIGSMASIFRGTT